MPSGYAIFGKLTPEVTSADVGENLVTAAEGHCFRLYRESDGGF
jgi:hypothetical protein